MESVENSLEVQNPHLERDRDYSSLNNIAVRVNSYCVKKHNWTLSAKALFLPIMYVTNYIHFMGEFLPPFRPKIANVKSYKMTHNTR